MNRYVLSLKIHLNRHLLFRKRQSLSILLQILVHFHRYCFFHDISWRSSTDHHKKVGKKYWSCINIFHDSRRLFYETIQRVFMRLLNLTDASKKNMVKKQIHLRERFQQVVDSIWVRPINWFTPYIFQIIEIHFWKVRHDSYFIWSPSSWE